MPPIPPGRPPSRPVIGHRSRASPRPGTVRPHRRALRGLYAASWRPSRRRVGRASWLVCHRRPSGAVPGAGWSIVATGIAVEIGEVLVAGDVARTWNGTAWQTVIRYCSGSFQRASRAIRRAAAHGGTAIALGARSIARPLPTHWRPSPVLPWHPLTIELPVTRTTRAKAADTGLSPSHEHVVFKDPNVPYSFAKQHALVVTQADDYGRSCRSNARSTTRTKQSVQRQPPEGWRCLPPSGHARRLSRSEPWRPRTEPAT
jgi:hypothetical protein